MNKLLAALIAGFFAVSVNAAFADDTAAPAAGASMEKPAAPPAKKAHKKVVHKKAAKKDEMKKESMKKEETK